jgi:hypothetical protein
MNTPATIAAAARDAAVGRPGTIRITSIATNASAILDLGLRKGNIALSPDL